MSDIHEAHVPNPAAVMGHIDFGEDFAASMGRRRGSEVDRMHMALEQYGQKVNIVPASEFAEYEELFIRKNYDDQISGKMPQNEIDRLGAKSLRFYRKYNPYLPIRVVDEAGNDVMPMIPANIERIRTLMGQGNEAIDIFHNAFTRDENTPLGSIKQRKASENLSKLLSMSQDKETIFEHMHEFDKMANEFHEKVLGQTVFPELSTKAVNEQPLDVPDVTHKNANKQVNEIDFFDYDD